MAVLVSSTCNGSGPRGICGAAGSFRGFASAGLESVISGTGSSTCLISKIRRTGFSAGGAGDRGVFVKPNSKAPCAAAAKQMGRKKLSFIFEVGVHQDYVCGRRKLGRIGPPPRSRRSSQRLRVRGRRDRDSLSLLA